MTAHGRAHRMAPQDAARLHMSVPENPMVIAAALLFDRAIEREVVEDLLLRRVLPHERFRQRVEEPRFGLGTPRWVDVERFDVRDHLDVRTSPAAVLDVVAERLAIPLDEARPLWSAHLVPQPSGASALVLLVHHCIADGSGLVALLAELGDRGGPPAATKPRIAKRGWPSPSRVLAAARSAAKLLVHPGEPATPLRAHLGGRKRLAFTEAVSLATVGDASHALGVTINDLLLAAVAGALRAEIERVTGRAPDRSLALHALVPVRLEHGSGVAGNQYASMFVPLPIGVADPVARARSIDHDVHELRARGAVAAGTGVVRAAGVLTAKVERVGVALFSRKATVMVSNVRGPDAPIRVAGASVSDVLVWAPSPGSIGVGVSLFSYAGRLRVGISTDSRLPVDPARIAGEVNRELVAFGTPSAGANRD